MAPLQYNVVDGPPRDELMELFEGEGKGKSKTIKVKWVSPDKTRGDLDIYLTKVLRPPEEKPHDWKIEGIGSDGSDVTLQYDSSKKVGTLSVPKPLTAN